MLLSLRTNFALICAAILIQGGSYAVDGFRPPQVQSEPSYQQLTLAPLLFPTRCEQDNYSQIFREACDSTLRKENNTTPPKVDLESSSHLLPQDLWNHINEGTSGQDIDHLKEYCCQLSNRNAQLEKELQFYKTENDKLRNKNPNSFVSDNKLSTIYNLVRFIVYKQDLTYTDLFNATADIYLTLKKVKEELQELKNQQSVNKPVNSLSTKVEQPSIVSEQKHSNRLQQEGNASNEINASKTKIRGVKKK